MQYSAIGFRLGYFMICSSPILSLLLVASALSPNLQVTLTIVHTSIIAIQLSGLTLYFLGSGKHLADPSAPFISILLILWGFFTIWIAGMGYSDTMGRLGEGILDELSVRYLNETWTWIFKGVLWIIAGLVILAHHADKS